MKGTTALLLIIFGFSVALFTEDETDVILSVLNLFKIGECILSSENQDEAAMKKFGKTLIATGFMGFETLGKEIQKKPKPTKPFSAIVIKTKRSADVKHVFVENEKRLHWFIWVMIAEDELDPEIRIPFNCQLFLIKKDSNRIYRLIEIFHVKNSTSYNQEFGTWAPGKGLNVSAVNMYRRRMDLNGVEFEITVCTVFKANFEMQIFWEDTAEIFNFSLRMEPRIKPNGEVPLNPDGSTCVWGIIGGDFDNDWIFSSVGNKVKLVTKFRSSNDIGWRAYVQPFTKEMWVAVGVWLLLSTAAVVIVNGRTKESFYQNAFTAFYCLCNSDPTVIHPPDVPTPLPTKLVYLMSLAVPAVIVPAYSAYILSTISIVLPLEPFKDIKSFIEDGTYKLAAVENTFVLRNLKNNDDPELKYIYENLFVGDDNLAPTFLILFEQLCKNNKLATLFVDHESFRKIFQCRMFITQQDVLTISTGILLSKGSPFRKMLNERLAQYHERGVKFRPNVEWLERGFVEETESLNSLNMSQMEAIFLLLPLGILLSLIVLIIEVSVKKRTDRRRRMRVYTHTNRD